MDNELEKLERTIRKIKIKEMPNTFFNIIGKSKDEVIISSMIAFLINPNNTSIEIIEKILEHTKSDKDQYNFVELLNNDNTINPYINTEEWISKRSRLDIIIKFSSFWIVIENKIDSNENNDQSLKYEEDLRKQTNLPIKYICLKPNYNQCELKNKNFANMTYGDFIQILKQVSIYNFNKKENYIYMEELIKHVEGYFMSEKELEISEDIEFYIENKEKITQIENNYKKQCEIVTQKLEEKVKEKLGPEYKVYVSSSMKWQYLQVWKDNWENSNHDGIHYELWGKINELLNKETEIVFAVHNENRTKNKYSNIKSVDLEKIKYRFDTSENVEISINMIVEKLYKIAQENDLEIDEEINRQN